MACQPKQPTGEKAPPTFQAPAALGVRVGAISVPDNIAALPAAVRSLQGALTDQARQLQQAFGSLQNVVQGLSNQVATPPATGPLTAVAGTVLAKAGDVLRLMPGPAGIKVVLPTARAGNKGKDVSIIVQGSAGSVSVTAVASAVQGQPISTPVVLTGQGLRVFRSDGGDGNAPGSWWIVGRNSADSTVALQAISAGTQVAASGTVGFANSNGVSFGMAGSSQITASIATSLTNIRVSAGTTSNLLSALTFNNANGIAFGLNGSVITGSHNALTAVFAGAELNAPNAFTNLNIRGSAGGHITFATSTNTPLQVTILASVDPGISAISAGTTRAISGEVVFSNGNGVSFGINGQTVTGSVATSLTAINFSAGTTSQNLSALVFSNSNGISFGLNGSTVTASHATSLTNINVSAGTTSNLLSALTFSNLNGVSFGLNGSVVTASVGAGGAAGSISAGTTSVALGQVVFSNSNNFSFGLNGSTVTASYTVPTVPVAVLHVEAGVSAINSSSALSFSNANNVSFGLGTNAGQMVITATVTVATSLTNIRVSAGTTSNLLSAITFNNANGISFGLNASTLTASVATSLTAINVSAGTTSNNLSAITFSNLNGVSFGLNGSVVTGSVAAAAAGDFQVIGVGQGVTGSSISQLAFIDRANASWNVTFGVGSSGFAQIRLTGLQPPAISQWNNFKGGNILLVHNASGASALSQVHCFALENFGNAAFPGGMTIDTMGIAMLGNTSATSAFTYTFRGGLYTLANSTQLSLLNSWSLTFGRAGEGTATRSQIMQGNRYLTVPSGNWSSSPVMSFGIQYFMATASAQAATGSQPLLSCLYGSNGMQVDFRGIVGNTVNNSLSKNPFPFHGFLNTTGIPTTIGATAFQVATASSNFVYVNSQPALVFRGGLPIDTP